MNFRIHQATMIDDDFEWHLHTDDCKDNGTAKYRFDDLNLAIAAENSSDALDIWIDDEMAEMGWTKDTVKVFDCAS